MRKNRGPTTLALIRVGSLVTTPAPWLKTNSSGYSGRPSTMRPMTRPSPVMMARRAIAADSTPGRRSARSTIVR